MSDSNPPTSLVEFTILFYPDNENITFSFDNNKSFGDLKEAFVDEQNTEKGICYFKVNDEVMDFDWILKDKGI